MTEEKNPLHYPKQWRASKGQAAPAACPCCIDAKREKMFFYTFICTTFARLLLYSHIEKYTTQ